MLTMIMYKDFYTSYLIKNQDNSMKCTSLSFPFYRCGDCIIEIFKKTSTGNSASKLHNWEMNLFFNYILLVMLLQLSRFFPLCPPLSSTPTPSGSAPPLLTSMGHAYKFFGFSISYTILNTHTPALSLLYLPIMLLNPCTFPFIIPLPLPSW